jgi:hypothetical protein
LLPGEAPADCLAQPDRHLKGIMSPVKYGIFFEAYKIKSALAQMVFKFLACLVQEKN